MQIIITERGNSFQARYEGVSNFTLGDTSQIARQRLRTGPQTYGSYINIQLAMQGREYIKPRNHRKKSKEKKYVEKDSGIH
jgi:beta-galactosidase beta subunit